MSDYLTDEEQVDRIKKLWRDYGLTVVTALVVGIGGTIGWDYYKAYESNQAQSAFDLYNSYNEATALGEPATPFIEELEADFGSSSYYVFTLLKSAKNAVDDGNFEDARAFLTDAYEAAKGTPLNDMVALRKAKVEFELKDYESVLQTLPLIETAGYRWQALMLQGDVEFLRDELSSARDAYQAALDSIPSGTDSKPVDMRIASVPLAS